MLVIRKAQIDGMSEYMLDRFVTKMVVHLRTNYPEKTTERNDENLKKFIRDSVDRAHSFNIRADDNLETFIEHTVLHGLDFFEKDAFKWAKAILEDEMVNETEKMNGIIEQQIFG
ncbi:MAG: hypothetical protein QNJ58_23505 [Desulfobacterales bacterium]|nr:hypothetical protein [Desulfobacterales bacterium]